MLAHLRRHLKLATAQRRCNGHCATCANSSWQVTLASTLGVPELAEATYLASLTHGTWGGSPTGPAWSPAQHAVAPQTGAAHAVPSENGPGDGAESVCES